MQKFHERERERERERTYALGVPRCSSHTSSIARRRWHLRNLLLLSLAPAVPKVKNEDRGVKEWFSMSGTRLIFIWREKGSGNGNGDA